VTKLIGGREIFFSETFILPDGETATFDSAARTFPLRIEVTALRVDGGLPSQAHVTVTPASVAVLQAGGGPVVTVRLENWDSTIPTLFLRPVRFGSLPDGTPVGYNVAVTAISGATTARLIFLQMYVGGTY
jgi:hypothetical protein